MKTVQDLEPSRLYVSSWYSMKTIPYQKVYGVFGHIDKWQWVLNWGSPDESKALDMMVRIQKHLFTGGKLNPDKWKLLKKGR